MSTWSCRECTTAYAVGLPACPHCRSTDYSEEPMPKITVHGGPSNADEKVEEAKAWPGKPSSPSPGSDDSSSTKSEAVPPKPARTTGLRSSKATKASSSAPSKSTISGRKTAD